MKTSTSQTLYAYWDELRGGRPAPRRFEVEPSRLAAILPHTFLLERHDSETFSFRLAGTEICKRFGSELRGTNFLTGWPASDHAVLLDRFTRICERASVGRFEIEAETPDGRCSADFEVLVLPLTHSQGQIDRFVGALSVMREPGRLGDEALRACRVIDTEIIQPDVTAGAVTGCQDPFHPHMRTARIVRADRRQFRVYDGGLARSEPEA